MSTSDVVMSNIRALHPAPSKGGPSSRPVAVDDCDLKILSILQQNGRISKARLAEEIGLSASACFDRVKNLESRKLIQSYRAFVNMSSVHPFEMFFTEVTLKSHRASDFYRFENFVKGDARIVECYALGGGIDYIVKFVALSVHDYQGIIDELLEAEIGIEKYFTYIVTKSVKTASYIPVESLLSS